MQSYTTIVGPPRDPTPCCWDHTCIHCREKAAERERQNFTHNARLKQRTDAQRAIIGLLPRRPRPVSLGAGFLGLLPLRRDSQTKADVTPPAKAMPGNSVLPANYRLA